MKFLIAAALVTLCLANDNINIDNSGNEGGSVSQNVNINNQNNIANINNIDGWHSWDSICDYGRGFAATRLFQKRICVVTKINKDSFPSLAQLSTIAKDKRKSSNDNLRSYTVNQKAITNIGEYGQHIESLCKGLPTYTAQEMPVNEEGFAFCHAASIITILGISFCF